MPHWRRNHETDTKHLRSADLYDDAASAKAGRDTYASPVVKIEKMTTDRVKSREKPRGELRNFAHFVGKSKPLGLNVTNCETLESIAGSGDPQRWVGLSIQLYVDTAARYPSGKKGPAIRIRPQAARGPVDTSPLPEVPAEARERLEGEQEAALREPGDDA
jgi:hypothetical protein